MFRGGPATSAHQVDPSQGGKLFHDSGKFPGRLVVFPHRIGQSRIGVDTDPKFADA